MAQENSIQTSDAGAVPAESRSSTDSLLDRSLSDLIRFDWETVAWILLFVVAAITRFYDLGARAMSHDESLHTLYSYYLYDAGNYEHNPMMHGPFLFHANALIYTLFGDTDTTARIVPCPGRDGRDLDGAALPPLYRPIGRAAGRSADRHQPQPALPQPLYPQRYLHRSLHHDLDLRRVSLSGHPPARWIMVMMLGMALGFITKENHFMNGAIIGAFFAGLAVWQVMGRHCSSACFRR